MQIQEDVIPRERAREEAWRKRQATALKLRHLVDLGNILPDEAGGVGR